MKKITTQVLTLVFFLSIVVTLLTGCVSFDNLTNRALRKMLEGTSEIVSVADISSVKIEEINDIDCDNYNKLVLTKYTAIENGKEFYYPVFVNTKEKQALEMSFKPPFSAITPFVFNAENKDIAIKVFDKMMEYINKYNVNCFSSMEHSTEFLSEITGQNGIIPIITARDAITNYFCESYNSTEDFTLFFEKGTAVPKYLAAKSTETVYNWNYPEPYLSVMDRETKAAFEYMFGPAYVTKTVWELAELTDKVEPVGKYQSLDKIPDKFNVDAKDTVSKSTEKSNKKSSSSAQTPAPAQAGEAVTTASNREDLYRSSLTYKRMEDIHNSELTSDDVYNEITEVIKDFDNKCEKYMNNGYEDAFKYLKTDSVAYKQQTEYKQKHPYLTQSYVSISVRTTRQSEKYYYAWVKEKIHQTENGKKTETENNWVYKLYKSDGQWYVDDYTQDPLSK